MVPSPRKRAPRATFDQTWDDNNAALFDPSSLPIARIPRAWERKPETKKTETGREKKIWRRFNLRSRVTDTTEDSDEEEHDVRARPVKKQQQISPRAMEKTMAKSSGKKRTFKATRWDRRKSVLPRKKTAHSQDPAIDQEDDADDSDETQGANIEDLDQQSFTEVEPATQLNVGPVQDLAPESIDRRGTFTFTVENEAETDVELPDKESLDELEDHTGAPEDTHQAEDTTIAQLFRSPAKMAPAHPRETPEEIQYPELPLENRDETVSENGPESIEVDEVVDTAESIEVVLEGAKDADMEDGVVVVEEQETLPRGLQLQEMDTPQDTQAAITPTSEPSDVEGQSIECIEACTESLYPALPAASLLSDPIEPCILEQDKAQIKATNADVEMLEATIDTYADHDEQESAEVVDDIELDYDEESADEDLTEASLQLNILRDYQDTLRGKQLVQSGPSEQDVDENTEAQRDNCLTVHGELAANPKAVEENTQPQPDITLMQSQTRVEDITNGLTLSFIPGRAPSVEPTPRKLQSLPTLSVQSAIDDATMSVALDDDTALLKDFLNRAAASKAEKAAVLTHRRESLQNRRDSDVIRHALASPRKVLEEKDPNSPSKHDNDLTLDLSQPFTLNMDSNALASPLPDQDDDEGTAEEESLRISRRSSRTKKSRLPAPASAAPVPAQASKIAIRRADGTEHVVLKKSNAQEIATVTRANTRKNKQGAFGVTVRLMKLALDSANLPPLDESSKEPVVGKNIRWDEQLAYYQENPEIVAEAESLATPDELGMPDSITTPVAKPKPKVSKTSTPKIRRVRGLGTANGTPGKDLLALASLLPDEVQEEKEAPKAPTQQLPKLKASKIKKMPVASSTAASVSTPSDSKLPSLDIMPVGVASTKERKSRLAAPKKVMLPQPVPTLPVEGKENTQRTGISGATPRKGIPAPKVIIPPSVGMESGLPRRRGRKI